jgi:hypothetical protein
MDEGRYKELSIGIMLIGLALILMFPGVHVWPWILVVIGLAGLPAALASNRGWLGWQGVFWMVGLAVLFWTGRIWPGILIMIGLSILLGGLSHGAERSTSDVADPFVDAEPPRPSANGGPEGRPFDVDAPLFRDDEPDRGDTRRL